jgi:hypothetical protein
MTNTEARDLAVKLTASWPRDPGVDISTWIDEIRVLDPGTVGTTIVRLRRDLERPPTIARFLAVYRSLDTASAAAQHVDCPDCAGDGWVTAQDRVHADGRHTSQVRPCPRCPAGREARDVHERMMRANGHRTRPEEPSTPPPLTDYERTLFS